MARVITLRGNSNLTDIRRPRVCPDDDQENASRAATLASSFVLFVAKVHKNFRPELHLAA